MNPRLIGLLARPRDGDVTLPDQIKGIVKDAAETWDAVLPVGQRDGSLWPYRHFLSPIANGRLSYFDRALDAAADPASLPMNIFALAKAAGRSSNIKLPNRDQINALRIVTAEVPALMRPLSTRGIGSEPASLWHLIWGIARGVKAPAIAEALKHGRPRWAGHASVDDEFADEAKPVNRDRVWKLWNQVYADLADRVGAQLKDAA